MGAIEELDELVEKIARAPKRAAAKPKRAAAVRTPRAAPTKRPSTRSKAPSTRSKAPSTRSKAPSARSHAAPKAWDEHPREVHGSFPTHTGKCLHCGHTSWREHPVVTHEGVRHATLAFAGCTRCGTLHVSHVGAAGLAAKPRENHKPTASTRAPTGAGHMPSSSRKSTRVHKTVDTSETALHGDTVGLVGHRQACPRGGASPCGAEKAGRCTICNARVRDHMALGKTDAAVLDLMKLAGLPHP